MCVCRILIKVTYLLTYYTLGLLRHLIWTSQSHVADREEWLYMVAAIPAADVMF